jgi:formylglycine-generating enzyme required for sulfatase activity
MPKTDESPVDLKQPAATELAAPDGAWKGGEYVNSLGMKFVPVPGVKVSFCVHPTRRQDYAAFARANAGAATDWEMAVALNKAPVGREATHPVVMVSWNEANAFCKWLSETETKRNGQPITYRLPTWAEWRAARGNDPYPWGNENSPPKGAGNYADEAARRIFGANFVIIPNYDDGYATTSPVGSFHANPFGLFDFGSNVQEWSADQDLGSGEMLVMGASWKDAAADALACREKPQYHESVDSRRPFIGFRCVLVPPAK